MIIGIGTDMARRAILPLPMWLRRDKMNPQEVCL